MSRAPRPRESVLGDLRHGWRYVLKRRAKLAVYTVTVAGFALSQGLLHGQVEHYVELGVALAGFLGVHQVPNARKE